jgi:hypothetical protein
MCVVLSAIESCVLVCRLRITLSLTDNSLLSRLMAVSAWYNFTSASRNLPRKSASLKCHNETELIVAINFVG